MSHQLLEDNEHHYLVKAGSGQPFRVAKKGLSEALHEKIRKMATGGDVLAGDAKVGKPVTIEDPASAFVQNAFDASMYPIVEGGKAIGNFVEQHPVIGDVASGVGSSLANVAGMGLPNVVKGITQPAEKRMIAASTPPPPGVKPGAAPKEEPAPAAPVAPVAPRPNVAAAPEVVPGLDESAAASKQQQDALAAQASAAEAGGKQQADAHIAYAKQVADATNAAAEANARSHDAAMESLRKVEAANAEVRNIDATIDPGRAWGSRSTGQKFSAILGLVLGSIGAGPDGINRAAAMLDRETERDIDIQKADFQARLAKGRAAVENANTLYGMHRQMGLDDAAATAATKAGMKEAFAARADGMAAGTKGQVEAAALRAAGAKAREEAASHTQDLYFKQKKAAADKEHADAAMIAAQKPRAVNANAAKQNGLMKGAVDAADELEKELLTNPTSPRIGQLRASLMLHLNKLQGGRFNEEINKMNQSLIPGNEGASAWQRGQAALDPSATKQKFDIVRRHIYETGGQSPNPVPADE